jgi:hypothetical protein
MLNRTKKNEDIKNYCNTHFHDSLVSIMESAGSLDEEEPKIYHTSKYYNHEELIDVLREKQNIFKTVLSLNCQSLSAKLTKSKCMLRC